MSGLDEVESLLKTTFDSHFKYLLYCNNEVDSGLVFFHNSRLKLPCDYTNHIISADCQETWLFREIMSQ
jgi:hypothetical protein